VKKAAIPAIVTGALGYAGGFFIPPTAIYDKWLRQDPNDFGGTWYGSAAGAGATLKLTEVGNDHLEGALEIGDRVIKLTGYHDSAVVLEGPVGTNQQLTIGLKREVGERYGADDEFVLLRPDEEQKKAPILLCDRDTLNITGVTNCKPLGDGVTFFARKRS
jgi:hypothetical protein